MHDLILVDSPKFHLVFDFAENLEVYHITVRGADLGSYDGVDVVGTNYHVHDIEVTNRDECVSVKSPTNHALVENLLCNQAGSGISIGSLNVSASIANVVSILLYSHARKANDIKNKKEGTKNKKEGTKKAPGGEDKEKAKISE